MILQASTNNEEKIPALETLCTRYWYPVYSFVRRSGISESDAEDLTQEFFADLLAKFKCLIPMNEGTEGIHLVSIEEYIEFYQFRSPESQ